MDLPPVQVRLRWAEADIHAVPIPESSTRRFNPDMSFMTSKTSDYGRRGGGEGADRFLLDQRRERMDMPATKEAVRRCPSAGPSGGCWWRTRAMVLRSSGIKHEVSD
jgi:hypothetical protein